MSIPTKPKHYNMLIAGKSIESESGARYQRDSPAHDVCVGDYPKGTAKDVDNAVAAARKTFDEAAWSSINAGERADILRRIAQAIRDNADEWAVIEALESGKPIVQARDEMGWAAGIWDYASTLCQQLRGDTYNNLGDNAMGLLLREPIGVVAMITPWNFPLLIISQKLPFALAAGCTAVIKPSELTPGTTLLLGGMLSQCGVPDGVVNIVTGYGDPVGQRLAVHPDVDMISFTGSTKVGKGIVAASQGNLKKVSLELGGKNPQMIFPDADLDAALDAVIFGAYFNMGECCNGGSRILLHQDIAEDFVNALVERVKSLPVGDPMDEQSKLGAIINDAQLEKILGYIASGKAAGARIRLGGNRIDTDCGRYIEPTIFDNVTPDMAIAREEIFGPVLSLLTFTTEEEAIQIANNTLLGLSASVWTRDVDTAFRVSRATRAGTIWINTYMDGAPNLPFGGYKESGQGRELGRFAIEEYTELKTVYLHLGPRDGQWHDPA